MSILTRFILKKFIVILLVVFLSLELFFVGMDLLQFFSRLPNSANLQLLYILYNSFYISTIALPLSIVFAWIVTLIMLVRSNELVAMKAIGVTNSEVLRPVILISSVLLLIYVSLQATPMAYSYEQKRKIIDNEYFTSVTNDVFLKYNDNYIFFKKLYSLEKKAEGIYIYKIKNDDIIQSIVAKNAYFQNDKWYIVDAKILNKPENIDINDSKLEFKTEKFFHTLEGFKPKILDNVLEKSNFSVLDGISALILLSNQDLNTNKVRSNLYYQVFIPFFVIPLILVFYANVTANGRFFNLGKFVSLSIFNTLIIWGVFFLLFKFSSGGIVIPELSLLLPFILWCVGSYVYYIRKINE